MLDLDILRDAALALPCVYETVGPPPSFWVGGQLLAWSDGAVIAVHASAALREGDIASMRGVVFVTKPSAARGPALIRRETASLSDVRRAVLAAWRDIAPPALVRAYDVGHAGESCRWSTDGA